LKDININDYNDLLSQVKLIPRLDFKTDHKELRYFLQDKIKASIDQWKKHLIHLFKITEKKNENKVKSNELADSLDIHSTSVFSTGAMQTLIKKGFVQEVKSQSHRPNTFILTESGLNKAMELLREFGIDRKENL